MALITCPECGKEISDKAKTCPNCGAPVEVKAEIPEIEVQSKPDIADRYRQQQTEKKPKNSSLGIMAVIFSAIGCTFFVGIIMGIVDLTKKDGRKHTAAKWAIGIGLFWLIIALIANAGGSDNKSTSAPPESATKEKSASVESDVYEETEPPIEYIQVTAKELADALSGNAMKAKNDYEKQYIEVTGELYTIDSDGKYISLSSGEFDLTNIQCYIKSDEQKQAIMEKTKGDTITIKGYCKDVGEIIGYQIDIEEVK